MMAITSVVGTIYGQTTNFTRDPTTGKWVGTVTIPDHKGYTEQITLTATNSDGQTGTNIREKIYIFILLSFVTDRSAEDVARIKELIQKFYLGTITEAELAEWQTDLKGALNKSDITRIKNNFSTAITNYFSQVATYSDDDLSDLDSITTNEFPIQEHLQYLLNHLDELVEWAQSHDLYEYDLPGVPDMPLNTFSSWNDIETIIERIYLRTIDHHI